MYLTVCAVLKNETPYLAEWLEFHLLQGVEHFFLYENNSSDYPEGILKRYKEDGIVTWTSVKTEPVQRYAYNRCLREHGKESTWIAFIDIDEFLYCPYGLLSTRLKEYEDFAVVAAHWYLFGTSGAETKEDGLVIERFCSRDKEVNQHVKSIVQPAKAVSAGFDPHTFIVMDGEKIVDENFERLPTQYALCPGGTARHFRINHYVTKSKEELKLRCAMCKRADNGEPRDYKTMLEGHDKNDVADFTAQVQAKYVKWGIKCRGEV